MKGQTSFLTLRFKRNATPSMTENYHRRRDYNSWLTLRKLMQFKAKGSSGTLVHVKCSLSFEE